MDFAYAEQDKCHGIVIDTLQPETFICCLRITT